MARRISEEYDSNDELSFIDELENNDSDCGDMPEYVDMKKKRAAIAEKNEIEKKKIYDANIAKQLLQCGEVIERKLTWLKKKPEIVPNRFEEDFEIKEEKVVKPLIPDKISDRICKYTMETCPWKNRCYYRHEIQKQNGLHLRSKKIWLCRYVNNGCRKGNECLYAHSLDEVKENVKRCGNTPCSRVKRMINSEYYNVVTSLKCNRIHKNESIENFVKRTS